MVCKFAIHHIFYFIQVYGAAEQKTSSQLTTVDDMKKVREMLLDLKKAMEAKGLEVIEKKADQLLVEIV
jgi:hypothetical protein